MPATPYDTYDKRPAPVSSLSLTRFCDSDRSVPAAYGHRAIMVCGYVNKVVISCDAEMVALR